MQPRMADIDFEAEGLLEGLDGEEREARERLLAELARRRRRARGAARGRRRGPPRPAAGRAGAQRRRAALHRRPRSPSAAGSTSSSCATPVARARAGARRRRRRASTPSGTSRRRKRVAALLDAGIPEEGVLEVARLLGMTMSQLAAANRRLIAEAFMRQGDTEYDVAEPLRGRGARRSCR